MSMFDGFFAKNNNSSEPNLPYETLSVAGAEAVACCLQLREEGAGHFTPVMLGDPKELNLLLDVFKTNQRTPQEIITLAEKISMTSFMEKRLNEEEEDYYQDVETGEWRDEIAPVEHLTGHIDIVQGVPLKTVAICKVPTPYSWEVPAYFAFGDWNECPTPEEHVALLRYWHEHYGAEIITLSNDVLECTVSRPPLDKEQALTLAHEQFVYCSDLVYQGTDTLSTLAASLYKGKTWFFWWD